MNKVRLFIITNSAILSVWLVTSFITKFDSPTEVVDSPTPSTVVTFHEVE